MLDQNLHAHQHETDTTDEDRLGFISEAEMCIRDRGYSDSFSFNHPAGKCPRCDGLGMVTDLDIHKLVDFDKCLNDEDVIHFPTFTTGAWRWKRYAYSGLFDLDKKIRDYSPEELELFLYSPQIRLKNPPSNWPKSARFEGIYPRTVSYTHLDVYKRQLLICWIL